ncbi:DMT family transporter [Trinickia acidisoli]|uniref:DMT family transporter n=1 Tax=Trinickia acidisoli TaxID=2767482 RepID=UPI001A8F1A39|nr:DMT family transporter [Trinickia acidisoli]
MNSRLTGYLFCTLAMIGVGSTVVASKLIAHGLPPFAATALRFAIAFPLFVLAMQLTGEAWPRVSRREALLLLLQSAAGSMGYTVLLLSGMRLTSATDAGVIAGSLPAVAALVAVVALRERPGMLTIGAVALATLGVAVCTLHTAGASEPAGVSAPASASASMLLGNVFVLLAVLCEALFILLNKRLRTPVSPLQMSTLMSGIGLALSFIPALLERPWTMAYDPTAIEGVVYYALVPTVGGFMLWFAGAARIAGAQASALTAFVPISAAIFAAAVLHETIGVAQWGAMACVLGAVLLIACEGARRRDANASSVTVHRLRID